MLDFTKFTIKLIIFLSKKLIISSRSYAALKFWKLRPCLIALGLNDYLSDNVTIFRKKISSAVNFVNSSKSETQHVIHKIYTHVIETPPSKLETQHGVHRA